MGNQLAPQAGNYDLPSYLSELPDLTHTDHLGGGRVLKTTQCLRGDREVVVKIHVKTGPSFGGGGGGGGSLPGPGLGQQEQGLGPQSPLQAYQDLLLRIRDRLSQHPTPLIVPLHPMEETDKAVFMIRQYFAHNLHDRFHSHPFFSGTEKLWLTHQLLTAVAQLHAAGVRHGDIKSENVMVTTWNGLLLTDIAFHKPTYLPADDPAAVYNYFFDAGQRRRCYLAVERFAYRRYGGSSSSSGGSSGELDPEEEFETHRHRGLGVTGEAEEEIFGGSDGLLTEAMDLFSVGCVIAEIWLEGEAVFDLPQLLLYGEGKYNPGVVIRKISHRGIARMVSHMLNRDPDKRLSARDYLRRGFRDGIFPEYFRTIDTIYSDLLSPELTQPLHKIQYIRDQYPIVMQDVCGVDPRETIKRFRLAARQRLSDLTLKVFADTGPSREQLDPIPPYSSSSEEESDSDHPVSPGALEDLPPGSSEEEEEDEDWLERGLEIRGGGVGGDDPFHDPLHPTSEDDMSAPAFSSDGEEEEELEGGEFSPGAEEKSSDAGLPPPPTFEELEREEEEEAEALRRQQQQQAQQEDEQEEESREHPLHPGTDGHGLSLITSVLCSMVHNVQFPSGKVITLNLLLDIAHFVDDSTRLGRLIPYTVSLLTDPHAVVRATAIRCLTTTLSLVQSLTQADAQIFPEYIQPVISKLPHDPEEFVQLVYADSLASLADSARRFFDMTYFSNQKSELVAVDSLRKKGIHPPSTAVDPRPLMDRSNGSESSYDAELDALQNNVKVLVTDLLTQGSSRVKRSLLAHITELCGFMGRERVNQELLPYLITVLNEREEDWQLRAAFFEHIVGVSVFVEKHVFHSFLLPLLVEQALYDVEEFVVQHALHALTNLCDVGLLERRVSIDIASKIAPLLLHPSLGIRSESISLTLALARTLGSTAAHCFLLPVLGPFLRFQVIDLTQREELLIALQPPVTRSQLDQALLLWASEAGFTGIFPGIGEIPPPPPLQSPSSSTTTTTTMTTTGGGEGGEGEDETSPGLLSPAADPASIGVSEDAFPHFMQYVSRLGASIHTKGSGIGGPAAPRIASAQAADPELFNTVVFSGQAAETASRAEQKWLSSFAAAVRNIPVQMIDLHPQRPGNLRQTGESNNRSSSSSSSGGGGGGGGGGGSGVGMGSPPFGSLGSYSPPSGASGSLSSPQQQFGSSLPQSYSGDRFSSTEARGPVSSSSSASPSSAVHGHNTTTALSLVREEDFELLEFIGDHEYSYPRLDNAATDLLGDDSSSPLSPSSPAGPEIAWGEEAVRLSRQLWQSGGTSSGRPLTEESPDARLRRTLGLPPLSLHAAGLDLGELRGGPAYVSTGAFYRNHHRLTTPLLPKPRPNPFLARSTAPSSSSSSKPGNQVRAKQNRPGMPPPDTPLQEAAAMAWWPALPPAREPRNWRPRGVLLTTLLEHTEAVTHLAVSRDNLFLVSGSADHTVRVWDCEQLSRTAWSKSESVFDLGSRVTGLCVCESSHAIACGSERGTVQVFKIGYSEGSDPGREGRGPELARPRYQAPSEVVSIDEETEGSVRAVEHFQSLGESILVYGTQIGRLRGWDLRMKTTRPGQETFQLELDPALGLLSALEIGPSPFTITAGTTRGFILVWDLRFQIPLRVWRHHAKSEICSLTAVDETSGGRAGRSSAIWSDPVIFVSARGQGSVEGFSLYSGECRMVLRSLSPSQSRARREFPATAADGRSQLRMDRSGKSGGGGSGDGDGGGAEDGGPAGVSAADVPSLEDWTRDDRGYGWTFSGGRRRKKKKTTMGGNRGNSLGQVGSSSTHLPASTAGLLAGGREVRSLDFFRSRLTLDTQFLMELRQDLSQQSVLRAQQSSVHGFLNCGTEFGVSAGSDRIIRFWDYRSPEASYRILEPGQRHPIGVHPPRAGARSASTDDLALRNTSVEGRLVGGGKTLLLEEEVLESSATLAAGAAAGRRRTPGPQAQPMAHQDAILALRAIEFPCNMLVTGGRDAAIKVWQ